MGHGYEHCEKDEPNWIDIAREEYWSIHECASIIINLQAYPEAECFRCEKHRDCQDAYTDLIKYMFQAVVSGTLIPVFTKPLNIHFFRPVEFLKWAARKYYAIPLPLLEYFGLPLQEPQINKEHGPITPSVESGTEAGSAKQPDTPDDVIAELRSRGVTDAKELAAEVDRRCPGLSDAKLGGLLPAKMGVEVSWDAQNSRGRRLRGKKK